ncbi:MAG: hypothetical protein RLT05_11770 [Bauldia litoralis]
MTTKNEGEGNKSADREYRKDTRDFIDSGKVDEAAEKAKAAVEGDEAERLKKAEKIGRTGDPGKA